jgi:hypothetical protein
MDGDYVPVNPVFEPGKFTGFVGYGDYCDEY